MQECTKVRFGSEKFADEHLKRIREKFGEISPEWKFPKSSYYCKQCRCWHLTSQEKQKFSKEFSKEFSIEFNSHYQPKKMNKSEKKLENDCCMIARAKGLAAVKLEKNGHKGIPDRAIIGRGGKTIYVEFKNPEGTGVISPEQKAWKKFLGYSDYFISDVEEFKKLISVNFSE